MPVSHLWLHLGLTIVSRHRDLWFCLSFLVSVKRRGTPKIGAVVSFAQMDPQRGYPQTKTSPSTIRSSGCPPSFLSPAAGSLVPSFEGISLAARAPIQVVGQEFSAPPVQ